MKTRSSFAALSLAASTVLACSIVAAAPQPKLYMAWHAPYGTPGATENIQSHCGDGGRDTLFLTFISDFDTTRFDGLESMFYLRAPVGQTLSKRWEDERYVEVLFPSDSIPGVTRMWQGALNMTFAYYDKTEGSGRLRLSNTRPPTRALPIRDHRPYFYARVLFTHPPAGTEGCDQPICIEWVSGEFVVDSTASSIFSGHHGHEFVTMNSPNGAACDAYSLSSSPTTPGEEAKTPPTTRPRHKKKGSK